jgi:hypothetical protein
MISAPHLGPGEVGFTVDTDGVQGIEPLGGSIYTGTYDSQYSQCDTFGDDAPQT